MRRAVSNRIIPALRNALEDPKLHREIHYAARIALCRLDAQDDAPTVRDLASGRRVPVEATNDAARARSLLAAARSREIQALPLAIEWLHAPATPPLTLRAAVVTAGRLAPDAKPAVRRAIVDRFRAIVRDTSADLELRVVTCFALADAKTHASRLDLIAFARADSLPIRLAALLALHARHMELTSEERPVIARAVRELDGPPDHASMVDICRGLYGDKTAIPELVQRAPAEPDACLALGLMGEAQAGVIEALWNVMLQTDRPELRRGAALALVMLREPKVAHVLHERLVRSKNFTEQSSIVDILGLIGSTAEVEALIALLSDEHRPVALRASAVQALGRMGDLRIRSPYDDAAAIFVPGLDEPGIDTWLAQR